jgi:hypothetical protein
MDETTVDPAITDMVEAVRDRFGAHGLRAAARLIAAEIERTEAVTEAGLEDLSSEAPPVV